MGCHPLTAFQQFRATLAIMVGQYSDKSEGEAAFGMRGQRLASKMLELRLKTGEVFAISYHWLQSVHFVPESVIKVSFSTHEVEITGRHLGDLYKGLLENKIPYVQEGISVHDLSPESEPFVDSIKVVQK